MYNYLISLGSNIDAEKNILKSHYYIEKYLGKIIHESSLYKSEPVGFKSENDFINQSIILNSDLTPDRMLTKIELIDSLFNRIRIKSAYSDRPIDIDLILTDFQGTSTSAELPHPRWTERTFVIEPSKELKSHLFEKELDRIKTGQITGLCKFL